MGRAAKPRNVVLIIEDDRDASGLAAALLEETGLKVVEISRADDALNYLRQHAHDVAMVFADIRPPMVRDGVDLVRTIETEWSWIRLVVTSGNSRERLDDLPSTATYMPKPWRALDLLMEAERASLGAI